MCFARFGRHHVTVDVGPLLGGLVDVGVGCVFAGAAEHASEVRSRVFSSTDISRSYGLSHDVQFGPSVNGTRASRARGRASRPAPASAMPDRTMHAATAAAVLDPATGRADGPFLRMLAEDEHW